MSKHAEWLYGEAVKAGSWGEHGRAEAARKAAAHIERLEEIIRASEQEAHDALYAPGMDGEPWAMRGALRNIIARAALGTDSGEEET